jgi:hypothetical protein
MPQIEMRTLGGHDQHCSTFTRQAALLIYGKGCTNWSQLTHNIVFHNTKVSIIFRGTIISKMLKPFNVKDKRIKQFI